MATAEQKRRVLIGRDASDLAFRIGQTIEGKLIALAIRYAAARNAEVVCARDVEAAVAELGLSGVCEPAGDATNGEEKQSGADAA
jgi:hypothetical protein